MPRRERTPSESRSETSMVTITSEQLTQLLEAVAKRTEGSTRGYFSKCDARYDGEKDTEKVEAFLAKVNAYKKCENVADEDAIDTFSILLSGAAAIWWQGARPNLKQWNDVMVSVRQAFSPVKPPYRLYLELFEEKQNDAEPIDVFVAKKRALLSQFKPGTHSEETELNMVYGMLKLSIRKNIPRNRINNFAELMEKGSLIEEVEMETRDENPDVVQHEAREVEQKRCHFCKKRGHVIAQCRLRKAQKNPLTTTDEQPIVCFGCGEKGHIRSRCPQKRQEEAASNQVNFYAIQAIHHLTTQVPTVAVKVNGIHGCAQIDTAARTSVASRSLYEVLKREKRTRFANIEIDVSLADGTMKRKLALTTQVHIQLEKRHFKAEMIIFPDAEDNRTLLGIDFLEKAALVLNLPRRTFAFADEPRIQYPFMEVEKGSTPTLIRRPEKKQSPFLAMFAEALEEEEPTNQYQLTPIDFTPPQPIPKDPVDYSPNFIAGLFKDSLPSNYSPPKIDPRKRPKYDLSAMEIRSIVEVNEDLFDEDGPPTPYARHCIKTEEHEPIASPPYRLSVHRQEVLKKGVEWKWLSEQQEAFMELKKAITTAPILKQADHTLPFIIKTDASGYALGALLVQGEKMEEQPIEYASRLLNAAERNYTTTEKEALAIVFALDKFRGYIEGSSAVIISDHQPLVWLMNIKTPTGRLARWALQIQGYNIHVKYAPGRTNIIADYLSRPECQEHTESCQMCAIEFDLPSRSEGETQENQIQNEKLREIVKEPEKTENTEPFYKWTQRGYFREFCKAVSRQDDPILLGVYHSSALTPVQGPENRKATPTWPLRRRGRPRKEGRKDVLPSTGGPFSTAEGEDVVSEVVT